MAAVTAERPTFTPAERGLTLPGVAAALETVTPVEPVLLTPLVPLCTAAAPTRGDAVADVAGVLGVRVVLTPELVVLGTRALLVE